MLNKIINKMKKNRLAADEEYEMRDIMETIITNLKDNADIFQQSYKYEYNQTLDIDKLLNTFKYIPDNKIGIIGSPYKNEYGKVANNYVPYGIVGLVIENDIGLYNILAILNLLIQTKNSVIIQPFGKMATLGLIVKIIDRTITQINGVNEIIFNTTEESLKENNNIDLLLFIGNKTDYFNLKTTCEKKYFGIGNYELIVDKNLDNNLIIEARKRHVSIFDKTDDDNFYDYFNKISSNYCTALMTDSKKEARKFIASVKSSNVIVNAMPTLQSEINITIDDLMYKKSTLVWENDNRN